MKCHKYSPDDRILLHKSLDGDLQSLIGKSGYIVERHFGAIFDYIISINSKRVKVRESEIILIGEDVIE